LEIAMNRIFPRNPYATKSTPKFTNPLHRPGQKTRAEVEAILREVAYVLQLTRRVKAEMLHEDEMTETATV
jgi:hypothetical protein